MNLGGESYSFDKAGNIGWGVVQAGSNRLTSVDAFTMTYDDDGNLTRKHNSDFSFDQHFTWNSLGELVKTTTNGAEVHYRYDGLGRWAQREQGTAGSTDYLHDGDHLLLERSPAGEVTEYTYYPGIDRPHSIRRGSSVHYYLTDHPGDVVALLDESGGTANRYAYGPFGTSTGARESIPNPLQFQARHFDPATGLYHFRARWYDRDVGRFISEDPIGLEGGLNPYVFAANNPVNLRDPRGLLADEPCDPFRTHDPCFQEKHEGYTIRAPATPDWVCVTYGYCGGVWAPDRPLMGAVSTMSGAGGGQMISPRTPQRTPKAPPAWQSTQCLAAGLGALWTLGEDALFFTGVGSAVWAARAVGGGAMAKAFVRSSAIELLKFPDPKDNLPGTRAALNFAGGHMSSGFLAFGGAAIGGQGISAGARDFARGFIPIYRTIKASQAAGQACT